MAYNYGTSYTTEFWDLSGGDGDNTTEANILLTPTPTHFFLSLVVVQTVQTLLPFILKQQQMIMGLVHLPEIPHGEKHIDLLIDLMLVLLIWIEKL